MEQVKKEKKETERKKRKRGGVRVTVPPLPGGRDLPQEPTPDTVADGTRQEGTEN